MDPANVAAHRTGVRPRALIGGEALEACPDWPRRRRGVSAGEALHASSPLLSAQGSEHSLKTKISRWTSL